MRIKKIPAISFTNTLYVLALMLSIFIMFWVVYGITLDEPSNSRPRPFEQVEVSAFIRNTTKEDFVVQKEVEPIKIGSDIPFGKAIVKQEEEYFAVLVIPYQKIPIGTSVDLALVNFWPSRIFLSCIYVVSKIHK
ncbi:MAG: hypothetical protein WAV31_06015 [Candidatus Moraniibacteriota bacterium]